MTSVLVEGGATLNATLLRRRLIDKVLFFIAPKIIGGDGLSVIGACGVESMEQVMRLCHIAEDGILGRISWRRRTCSERARE